MRSKELSIISTKYIKKYVPTPIAKKDIEKLSNSFKHLNSIFINLI